MKCEQADLLIMKYMDGEISVPEAESLNAHFLVCPKCKESFELYDSMLSDMETFETIEAPKDFQSNVMAKITALPKKEKVSLYSRRDKIKLSIAGTFAVLLSIGALLINYRDAIIGSLMKNPYLGEYVSGLKPVADMVGLQTNNLIKFFESVAAGVEGMLSAGAGVISVGIIMLCALQIIIVKRRNR